MYNRLSQIGNDVNIFRKRASAQEEIQIQNQNQRNEIKTVITLNWKNQYEFMI